MKRLFVLLFLCSVNTLAQESGCIYKNPVIPGDYPDPSIIRVGEDYYAAATSSDFAPNYPLFHSCDLVNWERIGSIFDNPPAWIKGSCWAPELFFNKGVYYVYYTARKKSDNVSCIGVATTNDPKKGFVDQGIIIEWGNEAIDAFVFKDSDDKLYITWKAYGLDESRPIELLASELTDDGLSLKGEYFSLTRHDQGWLGKGDEGHCILKRDGYYYLFYSVGGCCDNKCDYRVEVARSKKLKEGWIQYDQNPVLQGGELWKCTGHGTIVQTPDGRYFYLYHAYHQFDFEFVGRQCLLDEILWDEKTYWPRFENGGIPSLQAETPFKNTIQQRESVFFDDFTSQDKEKCWLWDLNLSKPVIEKYGQYLKLTLAQMGICFWGINPQTGNYTIETLAMNNNENFKGLCIYGDQSNLFAWGIKKNRIELYKLSKGNKTEIFSQETNDSQIYLRIESIAGRYFRFYWSSDKERWLAYPEYGENINGYDLPQWGKGLRCGLLVGDKTNDSGVFSYFRIENNFSSPSEHSTALPQ
ncbi:MAG: glycoside hydrolase family 43 protein [Dysgonamonadaceae bacterium]|jgi:beta-xylosidase|nr:glycoside hydrolase family 43 protein [Dysgonamonadaceae bacterium]